MFEVGKVMVWYRPSADQRSTDAITVKIVRVARNGVIVEMPDGTLKRAARDGLKPPKPRPAKPFVRPTPPAEESLRMLGQPAGRIPPVMPTPWDPMIMLGDAEGTVHAVPTGTRAMCGHESATGWQWARGFELTCKHCCQKIAEDEFERDGIVQHLRKLGHDGPITREDYISFNWAGCSIRPWTAEHEDSLPVLLQDWDRFYKNAKRRERGARK
jgi:hypothetical protein